ncbi:nSTAND1 domain-containing NTPase [Nannocystis radixulma]|uniref:Protein kinase n=1 Tax=Nannocystis radixulma TaxID=2995305 RepID=A0ABT5BED9_9BACT|nr:protein kinase [Nannocystis radixulma]MDC0672432.1 protein kinase [Nannocystis radixulma]
MARDDGGTALGRATMPVTQPAAGAAPIDDMSLGPGIWLKHYEIIRELGRGGMGRVFLARDTRLARLCAIKLLLAHSGERAGRFLAEARATARCKHEHIVGIYEVDEVRGCPYMVLEYLDGRTLRAWLDEREPLSPRLAAERMLPVVQALACAHAMGIVHRDLKPENVLVTAAGQVKVLDFGVAKRLPERAAWLVTEGGAHELEHTDDGRSGTPLYMSPEQWLGGEVDERTDVWAAGIILHELVTGFHPLAPVSAARLAGVRELATPMPSLAAARPELGPIACIVDACLKKLPAERMASAAQLRAALSALVDEAAPADADPFAGLAAFQEAGAGRFFGRERDTAAVLARLRQQQLVVIAGPSGAGKSSLVRAGLIPALKRSGGRWDAFILRPGRRPLAALADVLGQVNRDMSEKTGSRGPPRRSLDPLADVLSQVDDDMSEGTGSGSPPRRSLDPLADVLGQVNRDMSDGTVDSGPSRPRQVDELRTRRGGEQAREGAASGEEVDVETLVATLRERPGHAGARLRAHCRGGERHVLLFVDQFEELYTLGAAADERATFLACLESAADDASSPVRVVLAVRSDFLDRVAEDRRFTSEVTRGLVLLPPLGREALRDALVRPLTAVGHAFEGDDLVEEMLAALASTRCPLPLLQFTAARLWDRRDEARRLLTRASYHALGGVAGALSTHADAVLATLSPREQRLARAILLRLVTPERTRAIVGAAALRALSGDDAAAQVVQHLAAARLLLIGAGDDRDGATVELVHESLIDRWARLRQWLDEDEQDAHFLARLRAAAQQWRASGRAEGTLWGERAAEDARAWLARRRDAPASEQAVLGRDEAQFLDAVVARLERAERRRRRRLFAVIAALAATAFVVSYLAVRADQEARRARDESSRAAEQAARADDEARQARNATRMAAARELEVRDPTTAVALVRELEPPGLPREWADLALRARDGGLYTAALAHPTRVHHAACSPDERSIVTAAEDHAVRLWHGDDPPRRFEGHTARVFTAAFSPDGTRIVSASADRTARVWPVAGGEPIVLAHGGPVLAAAWSPDGTRIASASADHLVRVWPAEGGAPLELRGHTADVLSVAWSRDGGRLASTGHDETTRVWQLDGAGESMLLREDQVCYAVAWSPEGSRLAVGCNDHTARVWSLERPGPPRILSGHEGPVQAVAWSPDGRYVSTGSYDATIRVWRLDDEDAPPQVLRGHDGAVNSLAWTADGRQILAASWDRTVRLWRPSGRERPQVLRSPGHAIHLAVWNPDGRVALADNDTAQIWDPAGDAAPIVLRGHAGPVYALAWSPDGRRLATASTDATARVWQPGDGGEPQVVRGHDDWLGAVAWSSDGRRLATASGDRTARVWDLDSGRELLRVRHDEAVNSVAWSPDDRRLLTASVDKTARLWDSERGDVLAVLRGHHEAVMSAAWSPDGCQVLTTSEDTTAQIWDADSATAIRTLRGHAGGVCRGAWRPDGLQIVTAAKDRTIRVWQADGGGEPLILRGHEGAVHSAQWDREGRRIVSASVDGSTRVWSDLAPLTSVDDPTLWTATRHCVSVEQRVALLNVSEAAARSGFDACRQRVAAAFAGQ